jgi:hypothetical protein
MHNALNWLARILSIPVTLAWGGIVALVVGAGRGEFPLEAVMTFAPLSIASLALLGGWRWPRTGGWMAVVASVIFAIGETFFSGFGSLGAFNLVVGLPFAINGLLFVVAGEARVDRLRLALWQAWAIGGLFATLALTLMAFVAYAVWVMNQAFSNGFSPP